MPRRMLCAAAAVFAIVSSTPAKAYMYDPPRLDSWSMSWHGYRPHQVRWHHRHRVVHVARYRQIHKKVQLSAHKYVVENENILPIMVLPAVVRLTVSAVEQAIGHVASIVYRPWHIVGLADIDGQKFQFSSGGRGASVPLGSHKITPTTVGNWGSRHGAIGLAGNKIWDEQLGRYRRGIEIHAARVANVNGLGCIVFAVREWPVVRRKILAMVYRFGGAYLNVGPHEANI